MTMSIPKVQLRRLAPEDAPVIARLINNKKVWDNLRDFIPHPYTEADAAAFIGMTAAEKPALTFGILWQDTLCGVIGLVPQRDVYRHSAEIGYWIGEPYWGKGIGTGAVRLMTKYGFEVLGLTRIFTSVMSHNPDSMRVLEKNGYALEGIFKNGILKNGVLTDEYRYGKCEVK
jgi:[ribosomal protein S5]-alanine N-acetyltransferase